MADKAQKVIGLGSKQLKANLNEDIAKARFIKNGICRWFFVKFSEASATLLTFIMVYLASTRQLQKIDVVHYFKQSQRRHIFIVIGVITLFCYAQDKFSQHEDDKVLSGKGKEDQNSSGKGKNTPISLAWKKMAFELASDFLRVANYYLVFYVLNQDVFLNTKNSHLIITKYTMIGLWYLFTARKVLFWVNILILQFQNGIIDLTPWESSYRIDNKLSQIQKDVNGKVQELSTLLSTLDALKNNKK